MKQTLITLFACLLSIIPLSKSFGAEPSLDMKYFAQIPILHEGRIKPLSSFARIELTKLSSNKAQIDEISWLADTLFNPQYMLTAPFSTSKTSG